MLWVFSGLLGGFAFVFLTRRFWADPSNTDNAEEKAQDKEKAQDTGKDANSNAGQGNPLVTVAIVTLIVSLLIMMATGKLHWLSAAVTAAIPFLRRLLGLVRLLPLIERVQRLLPGLFKTSPRQERQNQTRPAARGTLSIDQARSMLEVSDTASREDIVAAHRRLMARNHPDRGGSNYIAAQLNEAKALLLGEADV